jgi:lipopolysaccharide transport system permease protein
MRNDYELFIKPSTGWQPINFRELWRYRDLFWFLVWRDIKLRYRQTVLGMAWAVLQPLLLMVIFTIFFHRWGKVQSGGPPYTLFAFVGLVGWTFFANAVTSSSNSLIVNQNLVSKVYFPRIFVPLGAIGALALDLLPSIVLCFLMLVYYHWMLSPFLLLLPLFVLGIFLAASGLGLILAALNVQFRDIKYVVPFLVQAGIFITPVIYPITYVPPRYQVWLGLNPMAGMTEGFRLAMLGTTASLGLIGVSFAVSVMLFVAGLFVFRRLERRFADLI